MAEVKPLSYLRGTMTVDGTLRETQILTGARAAEGRVMKIYRARFWLDVGAFTNVAKMTGWLYSAALSTRQGLTSLPTMDDPDYIMGISKIKFQGDPGTSAPVAYWIEVVEGSLYIIFDPPIYIADDIISMYTQATTGAATGGVKWLIEYEIVTLTMTEALAVLESYR